MKLPVDFEAKVRQPAQASGGGYPVQLSAGDLMKNFTYAASDFDAGSFTVTEGASTRTVALRVPVEAGTANGQIAVWNGTSWVPSSTPPTSGTHVLGAVGGVLTWIATEEC